MSFGRLLMLAGFMAAAPAAAMPLPEGCSRLHLSGPPEYPPFSWDEGQGLRGAGFALVAQAANSLGLPTDIVSGGSWTRTFARHVDGSLDIIVSLYRTPEREAQLIYLPAWARENTVVVMSRKRPFSYSGWQDLIGRIGAASRSDSRGEAFDHFMDAELDIIRTPRQENAFAMLEAGRVDYVVIGEYSPFYWRFHDPAAPIFAAEKPVVEQPVHATLSRRSACAALAPALTEALEALVRDGTAQVLIRQYEPQMPGHPE